MDQYKNIDGTYTSPKNNKVYKSLKAFTAHWHYAGTANSDTFKQRLSNVCCKFCNKDIIVSSIRKHETSCYLNPKNITECVVCNAPIKDYRHSKGTCSRSCANTHFRSGADNGNWKASGYAIICKQHYTMKCLVCGETEVIDVHHIDCNRENNLPDNLIPLCPTHHAYMHRGKSHIIEHIILENKNKLGFA